MNGIVRLYRVAAKRRASEPFRAEKGGGALFLREKPSSRRTVVFVASISVMLFLSGCGVLKKKKENQPTDEMVNQIAQHPISPDNASNVLGEIGENWLYGPGFGQTALNVGAMVVFPPYAIYVLGNSVLSLSGYEPLYVSDLLPDGERAEVNEIYDEVTTAPGRVSAALAGKEFRSREVAAERLKAAVADGASDPGSLPVEGSVSGQPLEQRRRG